MALLPLERVEQLATFGLAGLQAFGVLAGHEETGDEAAEETEGDGDDVEHGIRRRTKCLRQPSQAS